MVHSALEEHVRNAYCPRCKSHSENEWRSSFDHNKHYLMQVCSHCGYELFYRVGFSSHGV